MAHRSTTRRTQRRAKTARRWSQNEKAVSGVAPDHGLKDGNNKAYSEPSATLAGVNGKPTFD
jgi:hypothetical protein